MLAAPPSNADTVSARRMRNVSYLTPDCFAALMSIATKPDRARRPLGAPHHISTMCTFIGGSDAAPASCVK